MSEYSSGNKEVEKYVDFSQVFVDGEEREQLRITGSSLNTSVRTLTPPLTTTMCRLMLK